MTPENEEMVSRILGGQPIPNHLREIIQEAELAKSRLGGGGNLHPDSMCVLVAASGVRLRAAAAAAQAPAATEPGTPPPPAPIDQPEPVPLPEATPPPPPAPAVAAPGAVTVIPPAIGRSEAAIAAG